jgi:nucleoside 2-deoxyribosyltransferase
VIKIILLGPLFTQAERVWNRILKAAIEGKGNTEYHVVLPQDEAEKFVKKTRIDYDGIVKECLKNAETFDVAVAILDGADADSGTCVELAWRKGRDATLPTVGVRTDFRQGEDRGLNAMIHRGREKRLCDEIIMFPFSEDVAKLATMIIRAVQKVYKQSPQGKKRTRGGKRRGKYVLLPTGPSANT